MNIQFKKLTSCEIVSELEDCLLVFDDSCEEIINEKECSKLATAGRQKCKCYLRKAQFIPTLRLVENNRLCYNTHYFIQITTCRSTNWFNWSTGPQHTIS